MTQTITALFDRREEAAVAVQELIKAGIAQTSIKVHPETDARITGTTSTSSTSSTYYDANRDEKGFWQSLGDLFMPEEDRHTYAEAMHRGSILVSVSVDDAQASRAEDILERHGTVELDQREAAWRKEGWTGGTRTAVAGTGAATGAMATGAMATGTAATGAAGATRAADLGAAGRADDRLQIVEERLNIGKRQVNSGRVKVRSYVVETPVSEKVHLRNETVRVERVAADRAVPAGVDPFKERTFEATATSEEAVVSKEARVTGEVRLAKTAEERVETVTDKVRKTQVDVEDDRATGTAAGTVRPASTQR